MCIRDRFGHLRFSAVFQFYAAKTKLRTHGISNVVIQVVKKCAVENPQSEDKALLLSLLYCLFEAQDSSLCQLVVDHLELNLNLKGTTLNLADCLSVQYFLTYLEDFNVNLTSCSIDADKCKVLFRQGELGKVYQFRTLRYVVGGLHE